MAEENEQKLKLNIKTTRQKVEVEMERDSTVKQLKELLSEKMADSPVENQCLIFAGRILKDDETLEGQGVKNGITVHLVVRQKGPKSPSSQSSATPSTAATTGTSSTTSSATPRSSPPRSGNKTRTSQSQASGAGGLGFPFMSPPGAAAGGSGDFQQQLTQMQQQLMSNPDLFRQMMENPMMQSFLSDPDTLQSMLTSNPQIQQLMERNPELTHVLHNPELMRQAMEMARNPAALRELMRSQDRQLSNIESIPGGFNALARMYTEIQEPMMDAAQESLQQQLQSNPFAALMGGSQQSTPNPGPSAPQGTPNTNPLPNPWARPGGGGGPSGGSSSSGTAPASSTTTTTTSATGSTTTPTTTSTGSTPTINPLDVLGSLGSHTAEESQAAVDSGFATLRDNPELMQRMVQMGMSGQHSQILQNPELLSQMMQSPMYHQMMEGILSNPQILQEMFRNHPMMSGNPELASQMSQMFQQNEFRQMFANPESLRAMLQVQQGMSQLQQNMPGMFGPGGQPSTVPTPPPTTTSGGGTGGGRGGRTGAGGRGGSGAGGGGGSGASGGGGSGASGGGGSGASGGVISAELIERALSQIMPTAPSSTSNGSSSGVPTQSGGPASNPTAPGPPQSGGSASNPTLPGDQQQLQQAEVLYQSQLEQLQRMGFSNRQANLRALVESGGDINAAVNRLLQ